MKQILPVVLLLSSVATISADVVTDAQSFINNGDYTAAAEILEVEIQKSPNSKIAGTLNQLLGECKYEFGDYEEARKCFNIAKNKGVADAYRFLGKLDYLDYNFSSAAENYSKYRSLKTKAKKPLDPDIKKEENLITTAENFLERVERIAIIDSLTVDAADFYKAYRLSPSSGSLHGPEAIPFEDSREEADMMFMNEGRDFIMWAEPDSIGHLSLFESIKLTDGTWHEPVMEDEILRGGGNANYPFMMPDGLTLYFANDGDESIGGYDIFVATRDASTGEYMQPQNIGMPYNSPYDDFMLAIDEQNGIGWWTTDRNRLDGQLTVYVFVPNEIRSNYNSDEDDVESLARIDNIKSTQSGRDFSDLLETIKRIEPAELPRKEDFHFTLKAGVVYTTLDDFKSPEARESMKEYIAEEKKYEESKLALKQLRRNFSSHPGSRLAEKIMIAETDLRQRERRLFDIRNNIYKSEKSIFKHTHNR